MKWRVKVLLTSISSVWIDDLHSLRISILEQVNISLALSGTAWSKENCHGGFRGWDCEAKQCKQWWIHTLTEPQKSGTCRHIVPVVKSWCLQSSLFVEGWITQSHSKNFNGLGRRKRTLFFCGLALLFQLQGNVTRRLLEIFGLFEC